MGKRIANEPQYSLAAASIVAGYTTIGTLTNPARLLLIQNLTDATIQISLTGGVGTNADAFPLASNGMIVLDFTANHTRQPSDDGPMLRAGSVISAKRIGTPATGSVYVSAFYEVGD